MNKVAECHPLPAAFFAAPSPNPFRYHTRQHFWAVLIHPRDMEMDRKDGMRAMAIIVHEAALVQYDFRDNHLNIINYLWLFTGLVEPDGLVQLRRYR